MLGILTATLFGQFVLGHVGGPVTEPWRSIWDCACFVGALISQNIHQPSAWGVYSFLAVVFGFVWYFLLWLADVARRRLATKK